MHKQSIAIILATLTACGGSTAITPVEGTWTMGETMTIIEDSCNMFGEGDMDGSEVLKLTMDNENSTFTLSEPNGNDPILCTLDSNSDFTCEFVGEPMTETMDYSKHGADAVLSYSMELGGWFTSDTEGTLSMAYDMNCEGADCDMFSQGPNAVSFPCSSWLEGSLVSTPNAETNSTTSSTYSTTD